MNVLIAESSLDCEGWKGVAVVVDVLRTTTTLCALLSGKSKTALVCRHENVASAILAVHSGVTVFSEQKMKLSHEDNSPYLARKFSGTASLVVSEEVFKAIQALKTASAILLGGFCNFNSLIKTLNALNQDVLLVSASLFGMREEEDALCISTLKDCIHGASVPDFAVKEFKKTVRFADFKKKKIKNASKDLNLALEIDGLPVVPQTTLAACGAWAVCAAYPTQADKAWVEDTQVQVPAEEMSAPGPTIPQAAPETTESQPTETAALEQISLTDMADSFEQREKATAEEKPAMDVVAAEKKEETPAPPAQEPKKEEILAEKENPAQEPKKEDMTSVQDKIKNRPEVKAMVSSAEKLAKKMAPGLKGFFAGLADSIKKEKQELEQSLNKQTKRREDIPAPDFADPMDALLKKDVAANQEISAEQESSAAAADTTETAETVKPAETASPDKKETPQTQSAQGDLAKAKTKKAIVLLSGGLDSTTCLYWALAQGYTCEALSISYGQRHEREMVSAKTICEKLGIKQHTVSLNLPWLSASSLVDTSKPLPDTAVEQIPNAGIPSTYVPGRNLLFLSLAGSLLDVVGADAIVAGPNAVDFSGYPDCTPAFFKAAGEALNRGTSRGVSEGIEVLAPLMRMSKAEIVKLASELKVPFELTWSCYAGGDKPCGKCDSCKLRAKGFEQAGVHDTSLD